jgi:hypothetical protein
MKSFDHDNPANKAEWVFAFVRAYRELRPEIGQRYAETHALRAWVTLGNLQPREAAKEWAERAP